ncbi:MFS transporter [Blastococcus sp. Marseille-P5729]|uniref:MFS transporter n=1 Tax=Blastococcus sp. Marseille-P5729 TaxID=2086582 RepID=UPI000D0E5952|nr:MFS transporter [Blastococcus sp. Marseille-P5729]
MVSSSVEEVAAIQRRTVWTLLGSQVLGSIAVTAGIAMGGLILAEATGSPAEAGFAQAASTLGSALIAVPAARLALSRGRRVSLASTYLVAAVGAALVVLGSALAQPWLIVVGMLGFGAGQAASLQARFAGVDLATPANRGRTLSTLLFAVTVGGIVGPNISRPAGRWAESLGLERYAGPFLVSIILLLLATVWVQVLLRPDPLRIAIERAGEQQTGLPQRLSVRQSIALIWTSPAGRVGLLALAGAHAAMVAVMVMTPVHIDMHGHGLEVVGLIISGHVLGMYAFSPVMGVISDRYGARTTVLLGALILLSACAVSILAGDHGMVLLGIGLFLLGLGWSACIVGGSVLVTSSTEETHRPSVQGTGDLVMGLSAAAIAMISGVIVEELSYAALAIVAAALVAPMIVALMTSGRDRDAAR